MVNVLKRTRDCFSVVDTISAHVSSNDYLIKFLCHTAAWHKDSRHYRCRSDKGYQLAR